MVVISKRPINKFIESYPEAAEALLRWYLITKESNWATFSELKKSFPSTDSVENDLYVFIIGGNKSRLIARIIFSARIVFVRFVGTHKTIRPGQTVRPLRG